MDNKVLDIRDKKELVRSLNNVDTFVMKKYLPNLTDFQVVPLKDNLANKNVTEYIRLYKIEKIVFENDENNQSKLATVYQAVHGLGSSIITIIDSDGVNINYYIGVKSLNGSLSASKSILEKSFCGNFLGSEVTNMKNPDIEKIFERIEKFEGNKTISSCSVISSFKKSKKSDEAFIQGMEKLIDSMKGEKYKIVIISDPIDSNELSNIKNAYEQIYSQLVPFSKNTLNFGINESTSITESISDTTSKTISESISKTQTTSYSHTDSVANTKGISFNIGAAIPFGSVLGAVIPFGSVLGAVGVGANFSKTNTSSDTKGESNSEGITKGNSSTISRSISESKGNTEGSSRNIQIEFENKTVQNLMQRIDKHLDRLNECEDLGVWNSCAYFITNDTQTNSIISSAYQSTMRGEDSSISIGAINTWSDNDDNTKHKLKEINKYISKMYHPLLRIDSNAPLVSPAVLVSSAELSIQSGIPQKSVPGVAVVKYSTFAREVLYSDKINRFENEINLGNVYHLGLDESNRVNLNVNSLASHTFITGSTGSGKSNTVYHILSELSKKGIKFLVIEPAKGEYKNVFSTQKDVKIFGTNPYYTDMLRINPFSFYESVHVLEHIDRLIDIFNVCWPMYAAMPAILKEAIEKAYILTGWDLDLSINSYSRNLFPSFIDVLYCLRNIIDSSDFSEEVKSNYTGALVTRVKSLTNGITGRIFSSNEIRNEELFDSNVIVDLSKIGSSETKSMVMGILIMKLSEYRASSSIMNNELKHVTVLEEAHNILKRTSTEQISEGANLIGKSVEMISNSIAEMRTYGEGFIIADQSPAAVDMSAIRNTNTKIILRLPEYSDREVVGRAASLNDSQIEELSKLHTGVAAVYQNNWVESVLCNINYYGYDKNYVYQKKDEAFFKDKNNINNLLEYVAKKRLNEKIDLNKEDILSFVNIANIPSNVKFKIIKVINKENTDDRELSDISYDIVNGEDLLTKAKAAYSLENWNNIIKSNIFYDESEISKSYIKEILNLVLMEAVRLNKIDNNLYNNWIEKIYKGDIL